MRICSWTCASLLAVCTLAGAETAAVRQARERVETLKQLLQLGAASQKQVAQAESALREAQDEGLIAETLRTPVDIADLTDEQSNAATEAARRKVERQKERLAEQARRVELGVAPRTSLDPLEDDVAQAQKLLAAMEERAKSLSEIAAMIRAEQEVTDSQPDVPSIADGAIARITRFAGENKFGSEEFKTVVLEFEKKFDRKLPVSARGETALHRSMGFDHRGRVDVALNPDGVEGRWLMRHLEQKKIPFFAFRTAVRGQATAPHIHIGPPSTRIRVTD